MSYLSVAHLEKILRQHPGAAGCSFDLPEGATLSVIGSSGSGKTTPAAVPELPRAAGRRGDLLRDQTLLDGSRPPVRERSCGKTACISVWCSRISTCFHNTPPWKT